MTILPWVLQLLLLAPPAADPLGAFSHVVAEWARDASYAVAFDPRVAMTSAGAIMLRDTTTFIHSPTREQSLASLEVDQGDIQTAIYCVFGFGWDPDALIALYEGRHAEPRIRDGCQRDAPAVVVLGEFTQPADSSGDTYHVPLFLYALDRMEVRDIVIRRDSSTWSTVSNTLRIRSIS